MLGTLKLTLGRLGSFINLFSKARNKILIRAWQNSITVLLIYLGVRSTPGVSVTWRGRFDCWWCTKHNLQLRSTKTPAATTAATTRTKTPCRPAATVTMPTRTTAAKRRRAAWTRASTSSRRSRQRRSGATARAGGWATSNRSMITSRYVTCAETHLNELKCCVNLFQKLSREWSTVVLALSKSHFSV